MEMTTNGYSIPLRMLPNGNHSFSFDCGDDLFASIDGAMVESGKLHVDVDVKKTDEMMVLDFDITGTLQVQCAVCLDMFDYPIEDCGETITLRLGDKFAEEDDCLFEVDAAEDSIDLSQWIYEQAVVLIPIRCEHPLDEDGNPTCNEQMLEELDKYVVTSHEQVKQKLRDAQGDETDPRWNALKGLLGKD